MAQGKLVLARIREPESSEFEDLYALYCEAIPAAERKDRDALERMCSSPQHRLVVAAEEARTIGFLTLFVGGTLGLLEYMAVASDRRGSGIGSALYAHARHIITAEHGLPLLVEVESGRYACDDRARRLRRIAFYHRLGGRSLEALDYRIPIGGGEAPAMELLVDGYGGNAVPRPVVRGWIEEIYERVYDCGAAHPLIVEMLAPLPSMLRLC